MNKDVYLYMDDWSNTKANVSFCSYDPEAPVFCLNAHLRFK